MAYLAIILAFFGSVALPFGRFYILYKSHKDPDFRSSGHADKVKFITRIISLVLIVVAVGILTIMINQAK